MSHDAWMLAAAARPEAATRGIPASAPRARPAQLEPPLDTSRPVLIIDGGTRADLGLVRSLGLGGIPVHLLTSGRATVTTQSRYVTQTHAFPHPGASDAERLARIRAVAKSLRSRPVVLPSGDGALRFLSRHRADFADIVDHDLPDPRMVANSLDNARFAERAERLSLRVPTTWIPRDQQHIAGAHSEVVSVHVYVEPSGRILGSFTSVEAGTRPADAPIGSAVISRRNEELAALAVDIVGNLEYSGFAILQFKRDSAQDAFRLVEINCRYGAWTELPSRCGCNFPVAAYATITGQLAPVLVQREGVRCWSFFALDDPAPFVWQLFRRKTY
jgi:predicted ATP-grasp superfamily ATP-dependent carboligase